MSSPLFGVYGVDEVGSAHCGLCGTEHSMIHPHMEPDRYSVPPGYPESLGLLDLGAIRLSSPYGRRLDPFTGEPKGHTGIDIPRPEGEPVYATVSGKVTRIDRDGVGKGAINGNAVFLTGAVYLWMFLHLSRVMVTVGQHVRRGQVIGLIGSTGRSTGPHLHLQVRRRGGGLVDPVTLYPRGTFYQ